MTRSARPWDASRCERLRAVLRKERLDAMLVSSPVNVSYLTGFSGDSSYLVVGRDKTLLLSDGRFTEQIREECPGLEAVIRKTTGVRMPGVVAKICRSMHVQRLGIESARVTMAELGELEDAQPKSTIVGLIGVVETLRARKDSQELRLIREAIGFAERAFVQFRGEFGRFSTEKQAADRLESLMRAAGAERGSFDTIIAVGPHAAQGHARPDDRLLTPGQTIVVDWGASGRFYKSDLTRTICIRTIPAKLEAVYKVVLKAQEQAIQKIRPGVRGEEVDAEARSTIEKSGFGRFFTHGTGHGIGMEVHEAPALRPNSATVLRPGMVVTVEPGIYIRGWGGVRIEDDVLVTRTGHERLSTLPRNLDSVVV
jgi:Xaa-Pro aminopeptidase